ncbi:hypothetical protein Hypma_006001 [Hypsizygus marmoreus]|uniref:Uncharacterized protein n=1 Tax=Hypsizygus marmoreus TaxID=39966 RepID=A0A369KAY3_HYPMA|nr:hypothetical protein Hypma_006001 [Hypsizygus marmoreus]
MPSTSSSDSPGYAKPKKPEIITNDIENLKDPISDKSTPEVLAITETPNKGWRRQDVYEIEKAVQAADVAETGMERREKNMAEGKEWRRTATTMKDKISDPEKEMADE